MKRQNVLKSIFFSLILSTLSSSCGLIEKFTGSDQPTDSKNVEEAPAENLTDSGTDDLFSKTMNETKEETTHAGTDAPANVVTENEAGKDELKSLSLEEEFNNVNTVQENTPKPASEAESKPMEGFELNHVAETEPKQVKVEEPIPEIKSELPEAMAETNSDAGKVLSYRVQKGETLMQIAFKIYGDVSKWKDIKKMNGSKLSNSSILRNTMELKYKAPARAFIWKPEGTPYLIKTGETLGTISKSVYQTPKKWKKIWENNKPLIKNPNIIYAGFTLYYNGNSMANYVQPKIVQKKLALIVEKEQIEESKNQEEVKVDQAIANLELLGSNEIDLTKEVQSATIRAENVDENKTENSETKPNELENTSPTP